MKLLVETRLGAECEAGCGARCGNRVQRARRKVVKKGQPAWKFSVGSFGEDQRWKDSQICF